MFINPVHLLSLLEAKYNTIDMTYWEIVNFITISDDNIEILDKAANEFLKKPLVEEET